MIMALQYLIGEMISFKMRLGCIRVVLQDLTGGKTIIHAFRVYKDGALISHG